jgi:hypothetical protein
METSLEPARMKQRGQRPWVQPMLAQTIWVLGIFLEGLLLFRSWRARHFLKFPFFFSYVGFVLVQSVIRYCVNKFYPAQYANFYWCTEFVGVVAGCAVVLDFYRIALAEFLGVAKLARSVLLSAFVATFVRVLLTSGQGTFSWSPIQTILLARDVRFVAIVAIFSLLVLVLYYAIPLGRNLRGMILGYGLFLGISVINLSFFGRFGEEVQTVASFIQTSAYLLALFLWTISLWCYSPRRAAARKPLNHSYLQIFGETQERLARTRSEVRDSLQSR